MKKIFVSLAALAIAVAAGQARAEVAPGWYVAPGVALTFGENSTIHAPTGKTEARTENTNVGFLGAVGYAVGNGLRFEIEYLHDQHNLTEVGNTAAFGHISNNALLFNAYYDFKTGTIFTPYIGGGIGPDFVHLENYGVPGAQLNGDATVAAYQGIAGVSAQLDDNWSVTADYRYFGSFDPKVSYTGGGQARMSNASHNMVVGVRYSFGEEKAVQPLPPPLREVQAPAVKAAVPAQVAVAPVEENFTVFFDFDKSILTPEAKKVIAAAVAKIKSNGFARIVVTGHTDTVGTAEYNQKLSIRRANAVKAELTRLGIGASSITAQGVGENDLLVPTTEGIREAQNRRAEIVLGK
ncbi:MAG: OmpA family protein [Alphaproteobacteria bacterium]|nr:OmpA family protein [Alphaproteobacteria bacterium]